MSKPKYMERDMMKFVEDGVLSVDGEGRIWRLKKESGITTK